MSNMACQYAINDNNVSKGLTCVKRCTSYSIENDYMAKKIEENKVRIKEGLHWKWDVASKTYNPCKYQISIQSHHVWRNLGIQANHHHFLWKAKDYHFTTKISNKGPSVGYCKGNHMMLESYGHNMFYEPLYNH